MMITKLQVKYIQSLHQKKFRDQAGVFIAEGPKIINELLGAEAGIDAPEQLFATQSWLSKNSKLISGLPGERIVPVKEQELERLSALQTPNLVLAVFKKPATEMFEWSTSVSLMVDGIQDPGNMGTIIRIADWFGIQCMVCSSDCADAYAPKVVQASMGSIIRVKIMYTDLPALVNATPSLQLYAATLHGQNLHGVKLTGKAVIVIGNESKGITPALLSCCNHQITIPRIGHAESLNAAVATGIILSHLLAPVHEI